MPMQCTDATRDGAFQFQSVEEVYGTMYYLPTTLALGRRSSANSSVLFSRAATQVDTAVSLVHGGGIWNTSSAATAPHDTIQSEYNKPH